MKLTQSFEVARPISAVWDLFQDVPTVARCMPGVEVTEDKGDGTYAGRASIRLGPFTASFEGEGTVTPDPTNHRGKVDGRGLDKKGGSRSRIVMDYSLFGTASGTRVEIDADVQLAGPIAQFGRTGMITETAQILIDEFARNVEAHLSPPVSSQNGPAGAVEAVPREPPKSAGSIGAGKIVWTLIVSFIRRLLGGRSQP